jgi:hypothetical protein
VPFFRHHGVLLQRSTTLHHGGEEKATVPESPLHFSYYATNSGWVGIEKAFPTRKVFYILSQEIPSHCGPSKRARICGQCHLGAIGMPFAVAAAADEV